ncbi:MAG: permease [Devosia sp.]|uniref:permease n=1 Tax=Devosia sp. TaxID=1871048 RepID=UPI0019D8E3C1|nr:permease [Devosia sp.]MBF0679771.1 permease [Devosia sp.]
MTPSSGSIAWFAHHEFRLAWRDWLAMMSGGKRRRALGLILGGLVVYAILHLIAATIVSSALANGVVADKPTLVLVSGLGLLFFAVMLSQALESITRVYYARADLDLILSSPASSRRVFAVRACATAVSTMALSCLLFSPLINALAALSGPQWLLAYPVVTALSALAVAIAIVVTRALFALVGPKRTRLIAQVVAAIIGAGFVIGIQAAAIISLDDFSRYALFQSEALITASPPLDSPVWLPARGAMGEPLAALAVLTFGFALLALAILSVSGSYQQLALSTAGVGQATGRKHRSSNTDFRQRSQRQTLRLKEWRLLRRDPWLLSQTLMQLLYLVPPALLLWVNYGQSINSYIVVVPVIVMASGQLAGGLAWLALSGEDAADLVNTAPISPRIILRAKVEAVLAIIAVVLAPLLLLLGWLSLPMAAITALFAALSAASATAIQLWFLVPSRRALFRRRQVASRAATISEAFASILWAGTGAALAAGTPLALLPAILAILVLGIARSLAPRRT